MNVIRKKTILEIYFREKQKPFDLQKVVFLVGNDKYSYFLWDEETKFEKRVPNFSIRLKLTKNNAKTLLENKIKNSKWRIKFISDTVHEKLSKKLKLICGNSKVILEQNGFRKKNKKNHFENIYFYFFRFEITTAVFEEVVFLTLWTF